MVIPASIAKAQTRTILGDQFDAENITVFSENGRFPQVHQYFSVGLVV
jgi:hypothetical protein